ncbi:hypothetical protein IMZ08_06515 [Bacillus luteolus]|uniref:Uncharacterized protein n=1 Tax=Litchfieldia luteola TaxID=682179 RepID=A0ABR9QGU6_9BACI|nr:hypothetical protein [Cytobacillus luteolus]MBE4907705.1 hypothetical protein [Cytobacillus luteolus]MBP1944053.1 hypothetical protein [Cytobacillus luteolus]
MPITTGNGGFNDVFAFDEVESGADAKLNEDRYEVFINQQFIGHKTLLTQGDHLTDIDNFLKSQGITSFKSSLDGDHYLIEASPEDQTKARDALNVYFTNR